MKVVITESAKADLIGIGNFIHLHNPAQAATFVDKLLDRCHSLADIPRAYPLVPRYEQWGIRRCVHHNYLLFYRVREELIEIIHVMNGAQDYEALLFSDP